MRVTILGAGALGSLFAYCLSSRTSAEVRLLARSGRPPWVELAGEGRTPVPVGPAGPADLLLVTVKAYDTPAAVRQAVADGAVGPQTVALTLQNGLGNAEALADVLGAGRVLAGTTALGATLLEPGRVRRGGHGATQVAPWAPGGLAAERAPAVAALLSAAGCDTALAADPRPLLWAKLAINCGINALTAVLRVTNGELLARPGARRLMAAAASEAGAVAAASGVTLPEDPVERTLAVAGATAANRSSMLQDVERGRRTEIDAINGAVADRGGALGVPTPVNAMLSDLVRSLSC